MTKIYNIVDFVIVYIKKRAKPAFCPPRIASQFLLASHYVTSIFLYIKKSWYPFLTGISFFCVRYLKIVKNLKIIFVHLFNLIFHIFNESVRFQCSHPRTLAQQKHPNAIAVGIRFNYCFAVFDIYNF